MKKAILKIHEVLGLVTGIVVFIVSVTGCLWVFKDEIQRLISDEYVVEYSDQPVLTPTRAKELAGEAFPGRSVHGTLYKQSNDPVEVIFYEPDPEFYRSVYLNPFTGEMLGTEDHESGFFAFILDGHLTLWLPEDIGSQIVSISALLFMIILITGVVLWWPRKANRRQRLKFAWKNSTRWRRKNFDLHAITGFYIMLLAFALAFTGSVMAFDWFYYIVYKSAGGDKDPSFVIPDNTSTSESFEDSLVLPIDKLIPQLKSENPDAYSFEIHYPHNATKSIYIEIVIREGVYYSSDYRFFDQYTLEEVETPSLYGKYNEAGFADKVIRMNYDIHVGAIGGLPGKILAFIISLFTASLPVTGFLLWLGRRRKTK